MKYALMYYKDTDNIGDDIQTYAAKRFLPHIDYLIDRESLNCFIPKEKEYVSMIMNGWFLHNKLAWPPSPYINPLLVSMHFTSLENVDVGEKYLQELGGDYLKSFGKVGCRDIETQNRLTRNNIPNYFSGCMTLTIEKFDNIEKQEYVCIVDVDKSVESILEKSTNREVRKITHSVNSEQIKNETYEKRMKDVENLLKTYQAAHLVITSRLHVALPCIALGTPVILVIKENYEKDRLETFLKYPSKYYFVENIKSMNQEELNEIFENVTDNNNEYMEIRKNLEIICNDFINKCEQSNYDITYLPDVKDYYNNYTKNIEWYKDLHEDLRVKAKNNIYEYNEKIEKLIQKNEELYTNLKRVEEEINLTNKQRIEICEKVNIIEKEKDKIEQEKNKIELEKSRLNEENNNNIETLNRIYNSRTWKLMQKIKKIVKRGE